ncbi:MAG: hypothetical protein QOF98_459, partial [Streptomyces sp.]|nr:hypothetical protein [Streptomyces sp.]
MTTDSEQPPHGGNPPPPNGSQDASTTPGSSASTNGTTSGTANGTAKNGTLSSTKAGPEAGAEDSAESSAKSSASRSGEDAAEGYGAVFAVHEFRPIFAAHILSVMGAMLAQVALAVLVFEQTGSSVLAALVFAMSCLPYALSGVLLSGISDRYPARQVLVTCDLVCALCVAGMALPGTPVALLFVLVAIQSMISPLFTGTRGASLADILTGDRFILGRSLIRIVSQTSQIVGFGLGGLILVWLAPRGVLCVTVGTFLCSATLLRFGTKHRP